MRKLGLTIIIFLCMFCKTTAQQPIESEKEYSKVEIDNTEVRELRSGYNGQKYKIYIKFPRNYQNSKKNFPVLYILDAETNFGGVSYIVQRLIKDKIIPEILLVGIAYNVDYDTFYKLRCRDLTPTFRKGFKWRGVPWPSGGAKEFIKFITNELFPLVVDNYKTKNDDRAIYGQSLGGLFGTYIFLNYNNLFSKYLLLSPSLWWDDKVVFKDVKNLILKEKYTKLYMASGELESNIDDDQIDFIDLLNSKISHTLSVKAEILENETHRTIFGNGFTKGLRFIYSEDEEEKEN